ncbi:Spermidine/putrescine import ATP-binding protein PotA [Marinibacterium anthonyi]|nr:Spermidine/putrescine import ATP-binding protein PotA [Marinibacterium anthonyi]
MSVEMSGLGKSIRGNRVIDGIDVALDPGEFFVVLGPSGCGKSTLLRLVAGLETLDQGEIRLEGRKVSAPGVHVPPEARAVGVVFQSYALWPHMDVLGNVAFPAEASGLGRKAARDGARAHLETVDLGDYADRVPAELSGGQRQRVALARCLAGGARTVLMDEPLANLDPHLRGRMEGEITRFHREAGGTTIYVTHSQREAMALADRIAVMWQGRFLQVAPPQEIHDRPATEEVARFIGRAGILDATAGDGHAVAGPFSVACSGRLGPVRLVVRPGDVVLGDVVLGDVVPGRGVPARIEDAVYRGGGWEALARVEGLAEALPVASAQRVRTGESVAVDLVRAWALPAG